MKSFAEMQINYICQPPSMNLVGLAKKMRFGTVHSLKTFAHKGNHCFLSLELISHLFFNNLLERPANDRVPSHQSAVPTKSAPGLPPLLLADVQDTEMAPLSLISLGFLGEDGPPACYKSMMWSMERSI